MQNKVTRGQRVPRRAIDINDQIDALAIAKRSITRGLSAQQTSSGQNGIVTVHDISGDDQPQFSVMQITGPLIGHATNAAEFLYRFALDVDVPSDDNSDQICVLQEPLLANGFARAMIVGVTPALIDNSNPSSTFDCGVTSGNTYFTAGNTGALSLPGIESGTAPTWGLIRLGKSKSGTGNATARVLADSNITLSGTQTIDGVAVVAGDIVLPTSQTDSTENGPYIVSAGAWNRAGTLSGGMLVSITEGTSYGGTVWTLQQTGIINPGTTPQTWVQVGGATSDVAFAQCCSTSNISSLSGAQTIDSFAATAGMYCLLAGQSTALQNGYYLINSGAWTKVSPQPSAVVVSSGTANGLLTWINTAPNTWKPNGGTYS